MIFHKTRQTSLPVCRAKALNQVPKNEDIVKSSLQTLIFDTIAALLAALAIMPAVFAFGIEPSAGPSLMFITLPNVFKQMPMGRLFSVLFFLSVCFAGITSLINMFEAVIESWQNRFKIGRIKSVLLCGAITLLIGLLLEEETRVGNWMDFITIIIVPFGAVLGAISIYYVLGFDKIKEELTEAKIRGVPRINPDKIDVSEFSFDAGHINAEREHSVSREEAERSHFR